MQLEKNKKINEAIDLLRRRSRPKESTWSRWINQRAKQGYSGEGIKS